MPSLSRYLPFLVAAGLAGCQPSALASPPNATGASRTPAPASAAHTLAAEASLQPLLKPGDQVLAFKRYDLTGDGQDDAVAIVRHAEADASGNTCELLVLRPAGATWHVADRSPRAVDCLYNDLARNAKRLDDNLSLKTGRIVYINQQAHSNVTYTLKYDVPRKAWYLAEATSLLPAENPRSGKLEILRGTVRYPADFAWTPIARIDPERLQKAMDAHRSVVH